MNDLMIDIETLGTKPGSIIASSGAVFFDPIAGTKGDTFYRVINLVSAQDAGLTMDTDTILWWMKQNDEARSSTFDRADQEVSLTEALIELSNFSESTELREGWRNVGSVWANGPSFDLVLLEAAYDKIGTTAPWQFWQHRDVRTLRHLTGLRVVHTGTAHNALDDAIAQADLVIEAYRKLGLVEVVGAAT